MADLQEIFLFPLDSNELYFLNCVFLVLLVLFLPY